MGNRFHNKYHNSTHNTDSTVGDIESANDPMASPDSPFLGSFNILGDLNVLGSHTISGDNVITNNVTADSVISTLVTSSITSTDTLSASSGSSVTLASDLDVDDKQLLNFPLSGVSDVDISSIGNGDILVYNSTLGVWENAVFGFGIASDAEFKAGILNDKVPNVTQIHLMDTEFVQVSHPTGVSQTVDGTYTYLISQFARVGAGVFDTTQIRGIYVQAEVDEHYDSSLMAKYPDNSLVPITYAVGGCGKDTTTLQEVTCVPVNNGQPDITLTSIHADFIIIGVSQRIFE